MPMAGGNEIAAPAGRLRNPLRPIANRVQTTGVVATTERRGSSVSLFRGFHRPDLDRRRKGVGVAYLRAGNGRSLTMGRPRTQIRGLPSVWGPSVWGPTGWGPTGWGPPGWGASP